MYGSTLYGQGTYAWGFYSLMTAIFYYLDDYQKQNTSFSDDYTTQNTTYNDDYNR